MLCFLRPSRGTPQHRLPNKVERKRLIRTLSLISTTTTVWFAHCVRLKANISVISQFDLNHHVRRTSYTRVRAAEIHE